MELKLVIAGQVVTYRSAFNRTRMELKHAEQAGKRMKDLTFNRTRMELKHLPRLPAWLR